jgi:hypothetical protein
LNLVTDGLAQAQSRFSLRCAAGYLQLHVSFEVN